MLRFSRVLSAPVLGMAFSQMWQYNYDWYLSLSFHRVNVIFCHVLQRAESVNWAFYFDAWNDSLGWRGASNWLRKQQKFTDKWGWASQWEFLSPRSEVIHEALSLIDSVSGIPSWMKTTCQCHLTGRCLLRRIKLRDKHMLRSFWRNFHLHSELGSSWVFI